MQQRPATRRQHAIASGPARRKRGNAPGFDRRGRSRRGARPRSRLVPAATATDAGGGFTAGLVALHSHAEPRSIFVSLEVAADASGLSAVQITTLAMIVNELATNAIKHAFEADRGGRITISAHPHDGRNLSIIVDDDGLPFPELGDRRGGGGLGLGLVRRLMESIGGPVILPSNGSKCFEIIVPSQPA